MKEKNYMLEGLLIGTAENREYTSSLSGLERAMASGKILESMALVCDNDLSIGVNFGGIKGIIPKEEVALCGDNEEIKDIAVITRVGKAVCFKVMGIVKGKDGEPLVVLSRRAAQLECMNNYILNLSPGDIIPAKVTHMEHFGAFVDVGCGIVSLLSIDAISVSRISHPSDRFELGMFINTIVKSIEYDTGRIFVTHKELLGTWEENSAQFEIGQTVAGIVRSIEDYGIFVELSPNLAGLAEYRENITVGQTASVYIKNILPERMKVKLVLIDTYKGEVTLRKMDYYIDCKKAEHISYWRYSPENCLKVIETVFE